VGSAPDPNPDPDSNPNMDLVDGTGCMHRSSESGAQEFDVPAWRLCTLTDPDPDPDPDLN